MWLNVTVEMVSFSFNVELTKLVWQFSLLNHSNCVYVVVPAVPFWIFLLFDAHTAVHNERH